MSEQFGPRPWLSFWSVVVICWTAYQIAELFAPQR